MAAPDFWSNRERAQADVEEVSRLRSLINPFQELDREIEDFGALQQLAAEESDRLTARARRRKLQQNTTAWFTSWKNSSCASFFPVRTIERMHFLPFTPGRAGRNRVIGPTCYFGCTSAGSSEVVLNRKL